MAVIQRVGSPAKPRKWMSVHEMGDMLGLKKTDRYWLVHKNYFRTETLLGKMRVEIASFEKWYANQDWYHKVNGEAPGKELRLRSYSPKEIQEMLGTDNATVYEILKKNNIETITVNERMRVPTDAFWDWYHSQSRYRTQEDRKKDAAAEAASLSMPEMARLLDVPRSTVYGILSSKKYAPLLDVIVIAGRRRVTKESFERFLQAQDTYELFNFEYEELELEEKREYENYKRRCLAEADHSQEKKCLEYLTVPEAAELAGVEPATIAYWYTTGKISVRKTGKIITDTLKTNNKAIFNKIQKYITDNPEGIFFEDKYTAEDLMNNAVVYQSDKDTIGIMYMSYAVAPYAAGMPEFEYNTKTKKLYFLDGYSGEKVQKVEIK